MVSKARDKKVVKTSEGKADPKAAAKKLKRIPPKARPHVYKVTQFHRPHTLRLARNPKYLRTAIPKTYKFDKYRIVKSPVSTESCMKKIEEINTLTFVVDLLANKRQIKAAVKSLYDVVPVKVNTLVRADGTKRAYVKLSKDVPAIEIANRIGLL